MEQFSVFVVNLKKRVERKAHILAEFSNKPEFSVQVVEAIEHIDGAIGLWQTIQQVLRSAQALPDDCIILCEDDHQFTAHYDAEKFYSCIQTARQYQADIVSGGVGWFNNALSVTEDLCWMERFTGLQFTVIFRQFYDKLLETTFTDDDVADHKMSSLTNRKFLIYPYISTQKEFGYSDVTPGNNERGRVEQYFENSSYRAGVIRFICKYYAANQRKTQLNSHSDSYMNVTVPTYIINLPERTDRLKHVQAQFAGRDEFETIIVPACKHERGATGLWQSIRQIITLAIEKEEDIIIICEDDHVFTNEYSKEKLLRNVITSYYQRVELLAGGIGGFEMAVPVDEDRLWIDQFYSTQFLILYKSLFQKILDYPYDQTVTADGAFSRLTEYKMTLFPFISVQQEFGYSDVTPWNNEEGAVMAWFKSAANRLEYVRRMHSRYILGTEATGWSRSLADLMAEITAVEMKAATTKYFKTVHFKGLLPSQESPVSGITVRTRTQDEMLFNMMLEFIPADISVIGHKNYHTWRHANTFLHDAIEQTEDILVVIDEDAFIVDWKAVTELCQFVKQMDIAYAGVPDGGAIHHRRHSYLHVNPFFAVFNCSLINRYKEGVHRLLIDKTEFESEMDRFKPDWIEEGYEHDRIEPFAGLFYWLAKHGEPLLLKADELGDGISTGVKGLNGQLLCLHSWYSREYQTNEKTRQRIDTLYSQAKELSKSRQ